MTAGQYAYRNQFLKSREWRNIRFERLRWLRGLFGQSICECCRVPFGNDWRNGHHVTYPDNWYETSPYQIRMVCVPCHAEIHKLIEDGTITQCGDVDQLWEDTMDNLEDHRQDQWQKWEAKLKKREERKSRRKIEDNEASDVVEIRRSKQAQQQTERNSS